MWRQYETGVLLWKVWPERATLSLRTDVLLIKVLRGPACWSSARRPPEDARFVGVEVRGMAAE